MYVRNKVIFMMLRNFIVALLTLHLLIDLNIDGGNFTIVQIFPRVLAINRLN